MSVKYVLQFTKPIYNMIQFAYTDQSVNGEVVEPKDAILYEHIQKHVVKRWDKLNVPFHACGTKQTPLATHNCLVQNKLLWLHVMTTIL